MSAGRLGRYRLISVLGRGGVGEVWEALLEGPQGFRKPVALKVLHATGLERAPGSLGDEARLGAMLAHPNVVGTYDLGCADGRWYVAMELVRGASLAHLVGGRRLAAAHILEIAIQVCAGLGHIHAQRLGPRSAPLVHCDIKPHNVLVDRSGLVKIADLGVARLAGASDGVAGTPGFMAPEHLDGRAEPRSDLFSLGVTLYLVASRRRPFGRRGESERVREADVLMARRGFFDGAEAAVPGISGVLRRCLCTDPAARWPDAAALAGALRELMPHVPPAPPLASLLGAAPPAASPAYVSGSSARDPAPRGRLPRPGGAFVGRTALLAEAADALAGGAEVVTLVGPGGIGKTRLAAHLGRSQARTWPGGVWFCELAEARTADGMCAAIAAVLRLRLSQSDPVAQVGTALRGHGRALLILDNLEQLGDTAAAALRTWREQAPELAFLCTSQVPLYLAGERLVPVGPMDTDEAVALFEASAPVPTPPADTAAVRELVRQLEGVPLAIELAAARRRMLPVPQILARLADRFRLLSGGGAGRPERHRSLVASLDASVALLLPWEAAALAQLSVFAGGFTLPAAEAVIDLQRWPQAPWALDVVTALVDFSLVHLDREAARFRMLVAVQEYARAKLSEDEARAAEIRHGAWYAQAGLPEALAALGTHGGLERRRALTRELDNLVAAALRAVDRGDSVGAVRTAMAASEVFGLVGPATRGAELLARARAVGVPEDAGGLWLQEAWMWWSAGRYERCRHCLAEARRWAEEAGDATFSARVATSVARLDVLSEPAATLAPLDSAIAHFRGSGDRVDLASALAQRATALFNLGRLEGAVQALQEAQTLLVELGDRPSVARIAGNLGVVLGSMGRAKEAVLALGDGLATHRELGDRRSEGVALARIGIICNDLGRIDEAVRSLEGSISLLREVGDEPWLAVVFVNFASLRIHQGDIASGRELLRRAMEVYADAPDPIGRAHAEIGQARCDLAEGDVARAVQRLEDVLARARAAGATQPQVTCLVELALARLAAGDVPGARAAIDEGVQTARSALPLWVGMALAVDARVRIAEGDARRAAAALGQARTLAEQAGCDPRSLLVHRIREAEQAAAALEMQRRP